MFVFNIVCKQVVRGQNTESFATGPRDCRRIKQDSYIDSGVDYDVWTRADVNPTSLQFLFEHQSVCCAPFLCHSIEFVLPE